MLSIQSECSASENGEITLSYARLARFVAALSGQESSLEITGVNAVLRCGRDTLKMQGLPLSDLPKWPAPDGGVKALQIPAPLLNEYFTKSLWHAATEDGTRPALRSVMLVSRNGKLHIQATMGHRIIICETEIDFAGGELFVVPRDSASVIPSLATSGDVEIQLSSQFLTAKTDSVTFSAKLLELGVPDFMRAIPREEDLKLKIVCNREDFIAKLKTAATVNNSLDVPSVGIECDGKQISIRMIRDDAQTKSREAEACSEFDANEGSNEISFAVNPDYVTDALKCFDEPEVTLLFKDSISPFVIRNENITTSINPQRLS